MKIRNGLIRVFWLVFSISMLGILGVAMGKPLNSQIPLRVAFYTLIWVMLYVGMWFFACFLEKKFERLHKYWKYILPVFLAFLGIALFIVSCLLRSDPVTDYWDIYEAAQKFAAGQEVENWEYFARWTNNVGSMLVLSVLFKLGSFLPAGADVYYFVLILNIMQVLLVIACLSYLAGKGAKKHPVAASYMAVFMGSLWIPIWANTSVFYSDQLSFGAAVFGVTLLLKGEEKKKRNFLIQHNGSNRQNRDFSKGFQEKLWFWYTVGAGICFSMGMLIKATSATAVIALFLSIFLFQDWKKYIKQAVVLLGIICIVMLGYKGYGKTLPYQEAVNRLKAPVEYWIAVGLGGSGTYADNEEFAIKCLTAGSLEERTIIARQQIKEQLPNLWNVDHIVRKVRQNFGCGDLGAAGYLLWPKQENALWHWFSQEGNRYWTYAGITTGAFFAVLFIMGAGGIQQLLRKAYKREDMLFFVTALAFWGLCLFLMLWEAQDKQMYNHSGFMILTVVYGLNGCTELAELHLGQKSRKSELDILYKTH